MAEAQLTPRLTDLGDAWRCHLHRGDGTGARGAGGSGRGTFQVALVGALSLRALGFFLGESALSILLLEIAILRRIAPGPEGYEFRTFACPKCNRVQRTLVVSDPMSGDARGWLCGELKPPN